VFASPPTVSLAAFEASSPEIVTSNEVTFGAAVQAGAVPALTPEPLLFLTDQLAAVPAVAPKAVVVVVSVDEIEVAPVTIFAVSVADPATD